jgi:hypothetical protein
MTPQQFFTALGFEIADPFGGVDAFASPGFGCDEPYLLFTSIEDCGLPESWDDTAFSTYDSGGQCLWFQSDNPRIESSALDPSEFFKALGFVVVKTGDSQRALATPSLKRKGEPYLLVTDQGGSRKHQRWWSWYDISIGAYDGSRERLWWSGDFVGPR